MGKHCSNPKCLKKKNYKAKFLTISKLKKINSTKIILEKKRGKTLYQSKKYVAKHCSNPKCLKKKNYKAKFLTISILKKKFNKDNFRKKHVEKHYTKAKIMWRNTVAI